jgi:hypothetical protein
MKNIHWVGLLLALAGTAPMAALANQIYNRAPGFDVPQGEIAYLGSYYSPLKVWANGSTTTTLVPHDGRLFAPPFFAAGESQAVNETNQSLQEKATKMNLPLVSVEFNKSYQDALLKHVLSPPKYLYNPQISKFCGDRPYILVVLVDFYAEFSSSINIRENQGGQKINYFGRRSIIEKDFSVFRNQGRQQAVALEFFLVSAKDGSTLWQANVITTGGGLLEGGYYGIAKGLEGGALNNLMKK